MASPSPSSSSIQSEFQIYGYYGKESCGYCKEGRSASYGAVCPQDSYVLSRDYEKLMLIGWRRCGTFFYKPDMPNTCCPQYTIRLNANEFKPSKSQKKVLSRMSKYCEENSVQLTVETRKAAFTEEMYELYKRYQVKIHQDPPDKFSEQSFCSFLVDSPLYDDRSHVPEGDLEWGTFHQLYRLDGKLVAVGVLDFSELGLSSVYCFYDPDLPQLSLGKYTALREIEFVRSHSLSYYFLGFYIHTCPKMSYKGDYRPAELLCPTSLQWYPLEQCKELLKDFSFTPFEGSLAARRRDVEILVNEIKERKRAKLASEQLRHYAGGNVHYVDVGQASYQKELNDEKNSPIIEDESRSSGDNSQDEILHDVNELMNEFRARFDPLMAVSLDDIPIKLSTDGFVFFSAITAGGQEVLRPMFEEWMSVCPPELLSKINLRFN